MNLGSIHGSVHGLVHGLIHGLVHGLGHLPDTLNHLIQLRPFKSVFDNVLLEPTCHLIFT